ncbi:hypothetical protein DA097_12710 [Vibrio rotiferianus]|nr:hypothetical protein DA097_12710 [Vibrio rotiferianus]
MNEEPICKLVGGFMKYPKIISIDVNSDRLDVFEGRTLTHKKCAVVYFSGPEGWGVTMNIALDSVDDFIADKKFQMHFIELAKDHLGIS